MKAVAAATAKALVRGYLDQLLQADEVHQLPGSFERQTGKPAASKPVAERVFVASDEREETEVNVSNDLRGEESEPAPSFLWDGVTDAKSSGSMQTRSSTKSRVHRGTRGNGRRVARSGVVFCSLEDQALAIVLNPTWGPSPANLSSLQRELLNHHRREGCTLKLENGKEVVLGPGEQIGQVARAVREMIRVSGSFLESELIQSNAEALEDVINEWEHYYRYVDNVSGKLGLFRRCQLAWGRFQRFAFGSVTRPPLE